MWLVATYQPTAAFSLRSSATTSSGGRTNLVPTMYAVKIALIDAAFRAGQDGAALFPLLRDLPVRFCPPQRVVVTNTFVKILRESREPGVAYTPSVGFRELCHYDGTLMIAADLTGMSVSDRSRIEELLPVVNYFGKRSSFFQFQGSVDATALDRSFGFVVGEQGATFLKDIIIQYLDDFGPKATFAAINTFSEESARMGRDRVLTPVALPYRRVSSSRGYTSYVRVV